MARNPFCVVAALGGLHVRYIIVATFQQPAVSPLKRRVLRLFLCSRFGKPASASSRLDEEEAKEPAEMDLSPITKSPYSYQLREGLHLNHDYKLLPPRAATALRKWCVHTLVCWVLGVGCWVLGVGCCLWLCPDTCPHAAGLAGAGMVPCSTAASRARSSSPGRRRPRVPGATRWSWSCTRPRCASTG